ncbi:glutamate-5-semialdehyde dehydrogenase [Mycetocola reblochoni]|uniref:Gamma-glutamyl phosphate reductase n=2 Tax=Mycetocola reblochoni TaxID=331618 RepID=A0A1R4JEN1_9MICO|nr:glutamate-5-semialdehyde dehydrogenase [Mycetocola reblochoni]RLP69919.1 glutamate-5-semialdehyde dehydrogenase [Mycetocola reblochoni]SJN30213.1 Gamma-glutamyl phosphate reductase [Mycetocola reblochoni REB411]
MSAPDTSIAAAVAERLHRSRAAATVLATTTGRQRTDALIGIAAALRSSASLIIDANRRDLAAGRETGLATGLLDRLLLDDARVEALAVAVEDIARLADPVGQSVRGQALPNGVRVDEIRVPFGVVGAIYEARPNVTVDIAALALKSGNAIVLRGGSAAAESNRAILAVLRDAVAAAGLPADAVQSVDDFGRQGGTELMRARGLVDVLVPRGSAHLIETVVTESLVPVIETGSGVVHIVLDASAREDWAVDIVNNAKVQRPSVCNAVETVLVHRDAAERLLPPVLDRLAESGVIIHGDETVQRLGRDVVPATDDDWATEYLSLDLAVRVVDDLDEAIAHIRRYSTGHTESIITSDQANAERFLAEVDSAVVMVNASTRFTDGGEFGFGAEVGISTQKLHARGPMGLAELTSTKWVVRGSGQSRG